MRSPLRSPLSALVSSLLVPSPLHSPPPVPLRCCQSNPQYPKSEVGCQPPGRKIHAKTLPCHTTCPGFFKRSFAAHQPTRSVPTWRIGIHCRLGCGRGTEQSRNRAQSQTLLRECKDKPRTGAKRDPCIGVTDHRRGRVWATEVEIQDPV
jgi:hypothetical protein